MDRLLVVAEVVIVETVLQVIEVVVGSDWF
jgi:hypothetical protein